MKVLVLLFIFSVASLAQTSYFSKKDFAVALGAQGKSLLYKRGIITHKGYQVIPIYSVQLFNSNLLLAGSSLYYTDKLSENWGFRARLHFDATKDDPLYFTNEEEKDRVRREKTNELDLYFQYNFTHSSYLRFQYSKDLVAHKGNYLEVKARYDFKDSGSKGLIQPGLFASVGYGDEKHNEYLYGVGANKASINNVEYGISITSPKVIDNFWPTLKITRFEILGDENKKGSFVKEKKGFSVEALIAFGIW